MEEGENIWGCKKIFHSQNESETSSILSSEEGRHLTWGIIDEEHKDSDFVKELLTTWIGRGGPGQHLANQTGSLCDPLRQCKHADSVASCQLLRRQHFAWIFTSEAVKRKAIIDLACTCKIAKEERHGMFRSPATARPPILSTRRGRERFLVWILSYCYNILSFSRTHNFGREFVHIMCLRS